MITRKRNPGFKPVRATIHTEECWNCGKRVSNIVQMCTYCETPNDNYRVTNPFYDAIESDRS